MQGGCPKRQPHATVNASNFQEEQHHQGGLDPTVVSPEAIWIIEAAVGHSCRTEVTVHPFPAQIPILVLFLCTSNSARSIMGEALLNAFGRGRFRAFSAGSHPTWRVHPLALEILAKMQLPMDGLRSKSWDEFARPGAPPLDFVFTVCDNAAGEACPAWLGQPMTAHWGIEDPAAFEGSEDEK
jgi:arsenate reductase (thioredoxin)